MGEVSSPSCSVTVLSSVPPSVVPAAGSTDVVVPPASSSQRPRLVRKPTPILPPSSPPPHAHAASAASWSECVARRARAESVVSGSATLFDEALADLDDVDLDAIVDAAQASIQSERTATTAQSTRSHSPPNVIDLTVESVIAASPPAAGVSECATAAATLVDIEDLSLHRSTAVPLSLRPSPPLFSVTDFSALHWCELQVDLALRHGKRKPSAQAQAVMDAGTAIHLAYELETVEKVQVDVETKEDTWALRLLNMMMGVQEMIATGRTRELPVFGCLTLEDDLNADASSSAGGGTRRVWVTGIIDEVVRLDLFESEMARKRAERDAMPPVVDTRQTGGGQTTASTSAPRTQATPSPVIHVRSSSSAASGSPLLSSVSPGRSALAAEKRKRDDEHELEQLFGSPKLARHTPSPAPRSTTIVIGPTDATAGTDDAPRLVAVEFEIGATCTLTTSIRPLAPHATSTSLIDMDMDVSDDDLWCMIANTSSAAPPPAKPILPRISSAHAHQHSAHTTPHTAPKLTRSHSLPPLPPPAPSLPMPLALPPPPPPSFPVSRHHVVMDHKTRASNSMPQMTQKTGTYLQISIYKLLLDRWFGEEDASGEGGTSGQAAAGRPTATAASTKATAAPASGPRTDAILDDASLPPFPIDAFFTAFDLNSSRPLSPPLQSHLAACGLATDRTLGDLLLLALACFKSMHRTYRDMKVEYEYQKDGRHIGSDSYTFDRPWLEDELRHHLTYWIGHRTPAPVPLSEGFKCGRCEYTDLCDGRVAQFKRVGRLLPVSEPADATVAGDTNTNTPADPTQL